MITEDQLIERRERLLAEMNKGRQRLDALEREGAELRQTLLRIAGAIQLLDELLGERASAGESIPPKPARVAAVE